MKVRVSAGSAVLLGLRQARMDVNPTTIHTLAYGDCQGECGFCPQARSVRGKKGWLSRISWPSFNLEELFPPDNSFRLPTEVERICLQSILEPGWVERLSQVICYLKRLPYLEGIPLSVSARLASGDQARLLFSQGLDRLGIPLDVVNPELFSKIKGGSFGKTYALLEELAQVFPGQISTHLIIGLGETEKEAAQLLVNLKKAGVTTGLFAFTPVAKTPLGDRKPPPLDYYRRLQALLYLLVQGREVDLSFDSQDRIVDFGYSIQELQEILVTGDAFRTSGCPGCNRPYYNERPGEVPYNYPRPLTPDEVRQALDYLGVKL